MQVTCPTCYETFDVMVDDSAGEELEMDYDCEVCCRPLVIKVESGQLSSFGLDDL